MRSHCKGLRSTSSTAGQVQAVRVYSLRIPVQLVFRLGTILEWRYQKVCEWCLQSKFPTDGKIRCQRTNYQPSLPIFETEVKFIYLRLLGETSTVEFHQISGDSRPFSCWVHRSLDRPQRFDAIDRSRSQEDYLDYLVSNCFNKCDESVLNLRTVSEYCVCGAINS